MLVVAVPEGLPLAVTLALAYSVRVSMWSCSHVVSYVESLSDTFSPLRVLEIPLLLLLLYDQVGYIVIME